MRLLITTQAVDLSDPILGFFHRWIEEFAKYCEEVHVICLRTGDVRLPPHVHVHALGVSKLSRITHFYSLIRTLRYDAVFAHMNPEYVVLGGIYWRLRSVPVGLWFVHKSITWKLRVAVHFATIIFTAVQKSFPISLSKVRVMGHGIDTETMKGADAPLEGPLDMRVIGRISKSKGIDTILSVCDHLHAANEQFSLSVIGSGVTDEERAFEIQMRERARSAPYASRVQFAGPVRNTEVPRALAGANFFLNISTTGGLDKSVLEAALMEIPVLSTNPTFRDLLEPHGLYSPTSDAAVLVSAIHAFRSRRLSDQTKALNEIRESVQKNHALERLVPAILKELA